MDFRDLYKILRAPTLAESLGKRTQNVIAERQERQRKHFWSKRLQSQTSPLTEPIPAEKKKNPRAELLKKWKEEKLKKMEEEKKNKKPIFKVGVVHRKATGSPLLANTKTLKKKPFLAAPENENPVKIEKNSKEERQGVVTRSKARNMKGLNTDKKMNLFEIKATTINNGKPKNKFCKIESGKKETFQSHGFNVPKSVSELPYGNKLTYPYSPKMLKNSRPQISKEKETKEEKLKEETDDIEKEAGKAYENSFQLGAVEENNVKVEIIQKEIAAERNEPKPAPPEGYTTPEKSPAPGVSDTDNYVPIHYSPFVTVRRSRKSGKKAKKSLSMDVDEQIEKEEKEFRCRIFSFRKYIECETKRLLDDSNKWRCIYQDFQEIPSDVEGEIDSVIGKTNLLTSDKFKQFKDLIDKCEGGDPLIKIDDLQGFQDWVSIEVERLDENFRKLEIKKCNNWVSETVEVDKVKTKKAAVGKNPAKRPVAKSNIRSHILAARKLLKEGNPKASPGCKFPIFSNEDALKIATPIKKKSSLLKEVLNSSSKKKSEDSPAVNKRRNSGLEIMIATQKTKFSTPLKTTPNITNYEVFVNENQTPSRGILKKTPRTVTSSKINVTFHDDSENGPRGLDEKYLRPANNDENSPFRVVLGDLKNSASKMSTRSQTRLAASMGTVN